MTDPLDERDEAQAEVEVKRVREHLDEDGERAQLAHLLTDEAVRDYLWRLIERCGVLKEGFDANFGKTGYNLGRHSVGRMIIADINLAAPRAWLEMQLKAGEQTAAQARAETLKRMRKARST